MNEQCDSDDSPSKSFNLRDVIVVLVVAWVVRLAFLLIIPPGARSFDTFSWESTAKILEAGGNPYQVTTFLNWPPLWMQLIFCLSKVAVGLGVPFFRVLQIFLILVESAVIILLFKLIQEVAPTAHVRKIVMIGLALNPIAILLICQHCNFDVIVSLWLLLFMHSLLRYNRACNYVDWLSACLFLGLGILTKTVPLVLIPMLAGGFRQVTPSLRFLGFFLLLGPVTLGMSVIYVLAPVDITHKVLLYHSQEGYFGISGLVQMAGIHKSMRVPYILFCVLLLVIMTISWILFWRQHSIGSRETVLFAAVLLAAIPSLGPGYAAQYIYWFMPFLVATYAFYKGQWRVVLVGFAVISACTYLVEYALFPEFGYNLSYLLHPTLAPGHQFQLALPPPFNPEEIDSETGRTLFRLPLFTAYLTLLAFGVRTLFRNIPNLRNISVLKEFKSPVILALLGLVLGGLAIVNLTKPKPENGNKTNGLALQTQHISKEQMDITMALNNLNLTKPKPENGNKTNGLALQTQHVSKEQMDITMALNNLAWTLATSSDDKIRNGTLAVKLAERACLQTYYQIPVTIGTLAAAYAEAGRFDEAISTGQRACDMASELGQTNLFTRNQERVTLYQAHKPYHEPVPVIVPVAH